MSDGAQVRTIDDLASLRAKTEAVAKLVHARLTTQLEALRPSLSPRRMFGRFLRGGGRDEAPGAERAIARLRERYAVAAPRPFGLSKELDDETLSIEPIVDAFPFEYPHTLGDGRVIRITNPLRWVVSYRSGYTLAELESSLATKTPLRPADARQFVLSALALAQLCESLDEIPQLLRELRYEVALERRNALGELPLVTLRSAVPSFRPADEWIARATQLSGVPAFIELIDLDGVTRLHDPLREAIESALS